MSRKRRPNPKPVPAAPSIGEASALYLRIPEELEPLARDALAHFERGSDLVRLLLEVGGRAKEIARHVKAPRGRAR